MNYASSVSQLSIQDVKELEENIKEGYSLVRFVRHGESILNIPDPDTGDLLVSGKSLLVALSEEGERQATDFAKKIVTHIPSDRKIVVCSSTAVRAQKTAQLIVEELQKKFTCQLGDSYEGLCELSQGSWDGESRSEEYQSQIKKWKALSDVDKFNISKVKEGESLKEVAKRAILTMQTIVEMYPGKMIFIVSHGNTVHSVAVRLNSNPKTHEKTTSLYLKNCEMALVKIPEGKRVKEGSVVGRFLVA